MEVSNLTILVLAVELSLTYNNFNIPKKNKESQIEQYKLEM